MRVLEWAMALKDKMSGPARTIMGHVRGLAGAYRELARSAQTQTQLANLHAGAVNQARAAFDWTVNAAKWMGKVLLDAQAAESKTAKIFKNFLPKGSDAANAQQSVKDLAMFYGESIADMEAQFGGLLSVGLTTEQAMRTLEGALDMRSMLPGADVGQILESLRKSVGATKMEMDDLKEIGVSAGLGMDTVWKAVANGLKMDPSKLGADWQEKVQKAFTTKGLSGKDFLPAVLEQIQQKLDGGGPLGTAAKKDVESLSGALKRLANAPEYLARAFNSGPLADKATKIVNAIFDAFNPKKAGGKEVLKMVEGLAGDLLNLFKSIKPGDVTKALSDLVGVVKTLAKIVVFAAQNWKILTAAFVAFKAIQMLPVLVAIGSGFAGVVVKIAMTAAAVWSTLIPAFTAAAAFVWGSLVSAVGAASSAFGVLAAAIGISVGWLAVIILAIVAIGVGLYLLYQNWDTIWPAIVQTCADAWASIKGVFAGVEAYFPGIGEAIIAGLLAGLTGGWSLMISSVKGLVQQLPDSVKEVLGIHSPSKVGIQIGGFFSKGIGQGFIQDMARAANDNAVSMPIQQFVDAAVDVTPPGLAASIGAGVPATSTTTATDNSSRQVVINVNIYGVSGESGDITAAVRQGIAEALAQMKLEVAA